ncbi:hypothetical protein [uncultured Chryseobacterium sp.]|uniref:hypothetical protein n=1 Tax=uncultured Chryseobacterium sp. TaxID=259322 RepID=UPI0025FA5FC6|nr:hypothetical protein [uncultured Chryseobacterium sp.]
MSESEEKRNHVRAVTAAHYLCEHCGAELKINIPVRLTEIVAVSKNFSKRHKKCKPNVITEP